MPAPVSLTSKSGLAGAVTLADMVERTQRQLPALGMASRALKQRLSNTCWKWTGLMRAFPRSGSQAQLHFDSVATRAADDVRHSRE